jgi:hypothetical protein
MDKNEVADRGRDPSKEIGLYLNKNVSANATYINSLNPL